MFFRINGLEVLLWLPPVNFAVIRDDLIDVWVCIERMIVLVLLLAVGIGYGGWYLMGTPHYSLYRLKLSIEENDLESVEWYVDIDEIANTAVEDAVQVVKQQMEADPAGNPFAGLGEAMLTLLEPQLKNMARDQVRKGLREGFQPGKGTAEGWSNAHIAGVVKEGKVATVTIADGENRVDLLMRQQRDRHWKVVAIPTLTELLQQAYAESAE